ncbi:arsR family transcriptional regulator [Bordetella pertussis]|nr:arsR family transcriptional regulator [Bordetella pertussis]CFO81324.1 arsR family transcriptional regulator [Bordetella pertussis]CPL61831.1 arsR family transcriptional regulator [Bordetella pertussis]CPM60480.1 arsR family transcriptional regulator [Bordetella pertussis]CPO19607.1 arsR family transcriptional regulator [Bordetella pertussis]
MRIYTLAPQPLGMAEHWMTRQRAIWERRLDQLDLYLQDLKEQKR